MFFRKQFCMHASHEQMCNPKSEMKKIKTLIVNEYSIKSLVCLLFGFYRTTRELFTHMESSPLPARGCKI